MQIIVMTSYIFENNYEMCALTFYGNNWLCTFPNQMEQSSIVYNHRVSMLSPCFNECLQGFVCRQVNTHRGSQIRLKGKDANWHALLHLQILSWLLVSSIEYTIRLLRIQILLQLSISRIDYVMEGEINQAMQSAVISLFFSLCGL